MIKLTCDKLIIWSKGKNRENNTLKSFKTVVISLGFQHISRNRKISYVDGGEVNLQSEEYNKNFDFMGCFYFFIVA